LGANLHGPIVLASSSDHGSALVDRHASRLFDVHVLAGLTGMDGLYAVPVVGRGDQHRVDVGAFEQVTVIAVRRDSLPRSVHGGSQSAFVHVAHRSNLGLALLLELQHIGQVNVPHPTHADVADHQPLVGPRPARGSEHARWDQSGQRDGSQEVATG